ncbi:hypothetical protein [uncultured Marivita sp.]|uniref:hypothetical protein n=1 Tax=uncultured Marivita sp. TaxID=888080 RepID=UPI0025E32FE2|nr:hypothetical protein [uncultured Marivita sp.]
MTQINIAQFAAFDRQPVRFRYGEAGLHHVSAQAIAQLWRQIAWRGDFGTCLDRRFFSRGLLACGRSFS